MQTFLPYPSFSESAKVLDYRRLGKQRVEVLQLLKTLRQGPEVLKDVNGGLIYGKYSTDHDHQWFVKTPWFNHPAAKMWLGYENSLINYGWLICREWVLRGYKDTCQIKIEKYDDVFKYETGDPPWLGNEDFHAAHRSNLLRKDPVHYGQFGWTEPNDLPYIWPV